MSKFRVALGPMSPEIVEATFAYSERHGVPLALIVSKNQIDYCSGYVSGWWTASFMEAIKRFRETYPRADVTVCRDHCGPGFNHMYDPQDVVQTIKHDIAYGFDLIHIDFSKMRANRQVQRAAAGVAIAEARRLKPGIRFEIGTDEITDGLPDLERVDHDIRWFKSFCDPEFYVVNTGSLTLENRQVGSFDYKFVSDASALIRGHGMRVKEHNADFLQPHEIRMRGPIVDAVNIAPELGVAQTRATLNALPPEKTVSWVDEVWKGERWKKWLQEGTEPLTNMRLCVEAAGHYHFASHGYRTLRDAAGREKLVAIAEEIIDRYVTNLEYHG